MFSFSLSKLYPETLRKRQLGVSDMQFDMQEKGLSLSEVSSSIKRQQFRVNEPFVTLLLKLLPSDYIGPTLRYNPWCINWCRGCTGKRCSEERISIGARGCERAVPVATTASLGNKCTSWRNG